jgi:hypothetical protein
MTTPTPAWWARGELFENCNCTLVCPGHMHFSQHCTHDHCLGYWAVRIDDGVYGEVPLGGLRAIVAFDVAGAGGAAGTGVRMIDGNWTEVVIVDEAASGAQRAALEAILQGRAGGPWEVLARFVARWLDTRYLPIAFEEDGLVRRGRIAGLLDAVVSPIRGRDRATPVRFENIFNQIHGASQVLALGDTTYDDGTIVIRNAGTHGLLSRFEWRVSAPAA